VLAVGAVENVGAVKDALRKSMASRNPTTLIPTNAPTASASTDNTM